MFTGIIEEIGIVEGIIKGSKSAKIIISAKKVLEDVKLGDSVSTNGVCLTVTNFTSHSFSVDVMAETMRKSNLKNLIQGSKVNLERALRVGDRLGGHFVSGHIDGVGVITNFEKEENATWISVSAPDEILKYVIHKGSISIDGISLTIQYVKEKIFKVSIIPHTKDITTLLIKNRGDEVNLECDMVGKYIEKFLLCKEKEEENKGIDISFLSENGFI